MLNVQGPLLNGGDKYILFQHRGLRVHFIKDLVTLLLSVEVDSNHL